MKLKPIVIAIIIAVFVYLLVGLLTIYDVIPTYQSKTEAGTPRRYIDLNSWASFNEGKSFDLDFIFTRGLYILFILQSLLLLRKLERRNVFLIILFILSSFIVSHALFSAKNMKKYFISGLNPFLGNAFYIIFVIQIIISIYLNLIALKKLNRIIEQ